MGRIRIIPIILGIAYALTACISGVPLDDSYTHVAPEPGVSQRGPWQQAADRQVPLTFVKGDALNQCLTQATSGALNLAPCAGVATQYWTLRQGSVVQQAACLDVPAAAQAGAAIRTAVCTPGRATQNWSLQDGALRLFGTSLCATLPTADPNRNATLQTCVAGDVNQRWVANHTDPNGVSGFTITYATQPGKCVSVQAGLATDGAGVELDDCNGSVTQQWILAAGNLLTLSNKCYEVNAFDTTNGNQLDVRTCDGGANTQWAVQSGAIQLVAQPKCSDDWDGALTNGTKVALFDCYVAAPHQQWVLGKQ